MEYLRQVQRGVDYVEAHLDDEVPLADVARHAGLSQWHFQRVFKALTNETLKTYVRSRRFAHALDALVTTRARIIEIALAAGFESQESFTRAFKKAFGVTPAEYRRRGVRSPFVRKARFDAEYLSHINGNLSLEPDVYEQPALQLVGLRTCFFSIDSEKNNMADKLPALWGAFLPRMGEIPHRAAGPAYGVVRQTAAKTDELEYHAAVAVERLVAAPDGMVSLVLPPARYAKFTHQGKVANLDRTVSYVYSTWLARSGLHHTYGADLELYGAEYDPESERSVIYYAIPIA